MVTNSDADLESGPSIAVVGSKSAVVSYRNASNIATSERNSIFQTAVRDIAARGGVRRVCDVGGGPNPLLCREEIELNSLEYTLLDISETQLAKAPAGYHKIHADITQEPEGAVRESFDLVFSQWVAEHIKDGGAFHAGVHALLKPGGYAVHLFPTLFAIPFLANRVLPEYASEPLTMLRSLTPGPSRHSSGNFGKFPAYYSWCRGPTKRQLNRLEHAGFAIDVYIGFFGHAYYAMLGPVALFEDYIARWLVNHPIPHLTSSAVVVLQKR